MDRDYVEGWIKLAVAVVAAAGTFASIQSSLRTTALFCGILVFFLLVYYAIDLVYFTLSPYPGWNICILKWCLCIPLALLSIYLFLAYSDDQFPADQRRLPGWAPTGLLVYLFIICCNLVYLIWDGVRCWYKKHHDWMGVAISAGLISFGLVMWFFVVYTKGIP